MFRKHVSFFTNALKLAYDNVKFIINSVAITSTAPASGKGRENERKW